MNTLMLSCKKASELIDKQSVIKLSIKEKVLLHMHTSMCNGCKAYQKQSKLLDEFLQTHIHRNEANVPQIKNNEFKQQIISKLYLH
jgi:hypothetical protein